ncbi:MAG: pyridoxamine 5'-phosphate oxidase family protein [Planctomycetota bacterium]
MRKILIALLVFLSIGYGCMGSETVPVPPTKPVSVHPALIKFAKNLFTPAYYKGELSWDNAEFILHSSSNGRILTADANYSAPVSFGYCDERIYICSTPDSPEITNIKSNQKVLFSVDRYKEGEGWVSINIFGKARIIHDPEEKTIAFACFRLAYLNSPNEVEQKVAEMKVTPPADIMPKMPDTPIAMIEIIPEKMTSRLLDVPLNWLPKMPYLTDENLIPNPGNNVLDEKEAKIFQGNLPADTTKWVLYSCSVGRINTQGKDYPYSVPVNYAYFGGKVYLHPKNWGEKIENIKKNPHVSFSVDRFTKGKWMSVNVSGEANIIDDPVRINLLMNKYTVALNSSDYTKIEEITAQIKESPGDPKMTNQPGSQMIMIEVIPYIITSQINNLSLNAVKLPYVLEGSLLKTAAERQ